MSGCVASNSLSAWRGHVGGVAGRVPFLRDTKRAGRTGHGTDLSLLDVPAQQNLRFAALVTRRDLSKNRPLNRHASGAGSNFLAAPPKPRA